MEGCGLQLQPGCASHSTGLLSVMTPMLSLLQHGDCAVRYNDILNQCTVLTEQTVPRSRFVIIGELYDGNSMN